MKQGDIPGLVIVEEESGGVDATSRHILHASNIDKTPKYILHRQYRKFGLRSWVRELQTFDPGESRIPETETLKLELGWGTGFAYTIRDFHCCCCVA